ncbi:MAG: MBL fold metallo-hydrolase [Hyphomonadaceae bacterium]|nr:MBL fold metallo-hydrolase [Clostridia bacterium]
MKFLKSFILSICIVLLTACNVTPPQDAPTPTSSTTVISSAVPMLTVQFIDVGQGDSILITLPNQQHMLVDAGDLGSEHILVPFIEKQGVKKIDYVIATHPHADHIGGMEQIIKHFEIGKVYMPKATATSKTYEAVLQAIKAKGLTIAQAKAGVSVIDEQALQATFLAPIGAQYEGLNDYSAVLKLRYQDNDILLMGDAEKTSEQQILASGAYVHADLIKIGHHGSHSSSSPAFMKAVDPKYAVISSGKSNRYGHPHKPTLDLLTKSGIAIFRSDVDGTITATCDGKNIVVRGEK